MPESDDIREHHISSALISAAPEALDRLVKRIRELPSTEVSHVEGSRLIVVLEGGSTGEIGDRLTAINLMEGVLSATMVFERVVPVEELEETP